MVAFDKTDMLYRVGSGSASAAGFHGYAEGRASGGGVPGGGVRRCLGNANQRGTGDSGQQRRSGHADGGELDDDDGRWTDPRLEEWLQNGGASCG